MRYALLLQSFLIIALLKMLGFASSVHAGGYFVFYPYDGTINNFSNPTAVAIRYNYDGATPLKASLIKFFDGPSAKEIERAGGMTPFRCRDSEKNIYVECGSSKVFKSVYLENGTAYIELLGAPGAPTSAFWNSFIIPFRLTVTQFPNVSDFKWVVMGREYFGGLDLCTETCFVFPKSRSELDELIEGN